MAAREDRKRPEGPRWVRDQAFVDALRGLLRFKKPAEVAAELSAVMGYHVKPNSITKLKTASLDAMPASAYIGPICKLYGWPVPSLAETEEDFGVSAGHMYELGSLNPQMAREFRENLAEAIRVARKFHKPKQGNPDKPAT